MGYRHDRAVLQQFIDVKNGEPEWPCPTPGIFGFGAEHEKCRASWRLSANVVIAKTIGMNVLGSHTDAIIAAFFGNNRLDDAAGHTR